MSDDLGWLNDRQRDGGVDRVALPPDVAGELWLCGKHAAARRHDAAAWDTWVVLVERHEIEPHYPRYTQWLDAAGDRVIWFPIHDLHAPPPAEMAVLASEVAQRLDRGDRVLVHCAAGMGRAGTIAACVLITLGGAADEALQAVATARPGAGPEAGVQRDLVAAFSGRRAAPGAEI